MARDVYLINVGNPTRWIAVPFGLAFISKALHLGNIEHQIIDLLQVVPEEREKTFRKAIHGIRHGVFGFGLILGNGSVTETLRFAAMVKQESPTNTVVLGGPAATAIPKLLLDNTDADYIVRGEGEERFCALVENLKQGDPPPDFDGIISRLNIENQKIKRHTKIKKLKSLDLYSPPAYDSFDMDFYVKYLHKSKRCFDLVASRGCWGNCDFCFKFVGNGYHSRSADDILDEVEMIKSRWGIDRIAFTDENFLQNRSMFFDLMERMEDRGIDFRFRCMSRIDNIDDEIVRHLKEKRCISVSFGIESVNNETLFRAGKRIKIEDIEKKIHMIQEAGIEARASFILGFPDDTEADFIAMHDFIRRNDLAGHCTVNFLTPLPATRLYDAHKHKIDMTSEWDYAMRVDAASLFRDFVVNLTDLPDETLIHYRQEIKKLGQVDDARPEGFEHFLKASGFE